MKNQNNLKAKTELINKIETAREKYTLFKFKILLKDRHKIITNEKTADIKAIRGTTENKDNQTLG